MYMIYLINKLFLGLDDFTALVNCRLERAFFELLHKDLSLFDWRNLDQSSFEVNEVLRNQQKFVQQLTDLIGKFRDVFRVLLQKVSFPFSDDSISLLLCYLYVSNLCNKAGNVIHLLVESLHCLLIVRIIKHF